MSQVYVDGEYLSCSQADLVEIDRLASEKGITREAAAAMKLKAKPTKAPKKAKEGS